MTDLLNSCPTCGMQQGQCVHASDGSTTVGAEIGANYSNIAEGYSRAQYQSAIRDVNPAFIANSASRFTDVFDWRPIRSAPTDGTHVLVCWPGAERAMLAGFSATCNCWVRIGAGVIADLPQQPTHWQALPDPIRLLDSEAQS